MKNIQKTFKIFVCAACVCICGMIFTTFARAAEISTSASWSAYHANVPGAPPSASYVGTATILHNQNGATAVCNEVKHTNPDAYEGTVHISCSNYVMTGVTISNTGSAQCTPNVGAPTIDVPVSYIMTARTLSDNDTYSCKGNISKNK